MKTYLSLFCGLGGMSLGFQRQGFECLGAFDFDKEACEDHLSITGSPATPVDLGALEPAQLRSLCGERRPDVVITSPPCKSFSGCLPVAKSKTSKYRALSTLAYRGIWLVLEAWSEQPPPLIVMENVPRIQSRGRDWLDEVGELLDRYGYSVRETTHDCGEIGGLAQSRRRFLMVARHREQVGEYLYTPPKLPLASIGSVIGSLPVPVPGCGGGPMHRLSRLSALNWLRLALIRPGKDWRDLPEEVALSHRSARQNGGYGVNGWGEAAHTVVAEGSVRNTWASIADPRINARREGSMGVTSWDDASTTVIGNGIPQNGPWQVADPRLSCRPRATAYGVEGWSASAGTVVGSACNDNGGWSIADPRLGYSPRPGTMGVHGYDDSSITVIGDSRANKGHSVADPRWPEATHYLEVVDGRQVLVGPDLDLDSTRSADPVPIIRALDGTWHRPMTTLELAALQGFPVQLGGEWLELAGGSHKRWRQRIGNAVPPPAAEAIARECMDVLEAAEEGTYRLRGEPVWVGGEVVAWNTLKEALND